MSWRAVQRLTTKSPQSNSTAVNQHKMFICFIAKKVDTDTPNSTAVPTIRKFHVPGEETKIELMLSDLKT